MLTTSPRPIHTATDIFSRKIDIDRVCSDFIILNFILKVEKKVKDRWTELIPPLIQILNTATER